MDLHRLVDDLIVDTKGGVFSSSSIGLFLPELVLCGTIVLLLLVRLFDNRQQISLFWVSLVATGVALWLARPFGLADGGGIPRVEIFTGMLVYDGFTVMIRSLLIGFAFLFLIFSRLSGIPDREDSADIYALVLGATVGLCLMVSSNHMLMIFMAVEMASVPSYVLAGMLKGRRTGSEAALKYAIYGAGAAGVMLYGISLLVGLIGSAHLPTMAVLLADKLPAFGNGELMVLSLGGLMIGVGLAFKLSAVPFHFWCPDVFHGACAEVNAFLSVASKAAALALLVRVAIGLGTVPPDSLKAGTELQVQAIYQQQTELADLPATTHLTSTVPAIIEQHAPSARDESIAALSPVRTFIGRLIALFAIITCTFGNLAAYGQTNIKRLLAYSTIAHAGYMMMALAPVMVLAGMDAASAEQAVAGLVIYIVVYLFMNLGAFAVVAFLRNTLGSEEISGYRGLIKTSPGITICFCMMLFSLVGLPPLAGFLGKFAIFASLAEGYASAGQNYLMVLLIVGGINTAISLFYYLRVVKVMVMEDAPDPLPASLSLTRSPGGLFVLLLTAPTALLMINWEMLSTYATSAARYLIQNIS